MPIDGNTDNFTDYYMADVISYCDYTPYGMVMPGRNGMNANYRFSFQGQEKDNEIKGENNSINYKYRMHDPRIGRFFAVDPLAPKYPELTPYQFSSNCPIGMREIEGLEGDWIATTTEALEWAIAFYNPAALAFKVNAEVFGGEDTWLGKFFNRLIDHTTGLVVTESIYGMLQNYYENPEMLIADIYTFGNATASQSIYDMATKVLEGDPEAVADALVMVIFWRTASASVKSSGEPVQSTKTYYYDFVEKPNNKMTVYHKGELSSGKVNEGTKISTGPNKESVSSLNRNGTVTRFDIPQEIFQKWMDDGLVTEWLDYDSQTGIYNVEYRFDGSISGDLNQYIVTE